MANSQMGLIGRKIGMTQLFQEDGEVTAVTIIEAGPNTILRVKTEDSSDGYNAVQLGFDVKKEKRTTKAMMGHFQKVGSGPLKHVSEIRLTPDALASLEPGKQIGASDVFSEGDFCDVTGISKGRGFAGVMKRYNFKGFIRTHGTHEFFRHGGSIGCRLTPGHVFKGKKMPGHMGSKQVTIQTLKVARVDAERNLIFVKGGVPGPKGATVIIRKAVKK